jgi:Asp-tRNA(Asn)/Glu-tRNA(Gln) amidotransferase A subunit family amidase
VPSRLYYPKTAKKPLNGMRIAVKDNMHLNGIVTTLGSRPYTACYGVQKVTSIFVKHLIDQDAVIVGKTKLSAYAGAEVPPEKCIDYFAPWNARADCYQGPSGSSSGAGASIGGYSWLDLSLATDSEFYL